MSFEEALRRVLDREGLYWGYPGDETDDPDRPRLVEIRLDVPVARKSNAVAAMAAQQWSLADDPDGPSDEVHRLYFRRVQSLDPVARTNMLTESLKVASDCEGRLWTWINVEEVE